MDWHLTLDGHIAFVSTRARSGRPVAESAKPADVVGHLGALEQHRVLVVDIPQPGELEGEIFDVMAAAIEAHPLPVVASIEGACNGRSLGLALRADIRIASSTATVTMPPIPQALEDGFLSSLTRVVGPGIAGYWILAGPSIEPEGALGWGLFHELVAPERLADRIVEVARGVARGAPLALRYGKEAIFRGRDLPLDAALDLEADLYSLLQQSADRSEGVAAYLERREPEFRGE